MHYLKALLTTLLLPTLLLATPLPANDVAAVWELRCGGVLAQHWCTADFSYACSGNGQIVYTRASPDCDACYCAYA
ncbi:hypothetical protein MMC30_005906 [Trapelia coarctata]|nr:hypothetical protein [Trapelia coarctata]